MRPRKPRHILLDPKVESFKPRGIPQRLLQHVRLSHEELEALRLKNIEELDQVEAAAKMNTSQSTFQRVLTSAYKKISDALVNGKAIDIVPMPYSVRKFECWQCKHRWDEPFGNGKRGIEMACPECSSREIHRL